MRHCSNTFCDSFVESIIGQPAWLITVDSFLKLFIFPVSQASRMTSIWITIVVCLHRFLAVRYPTHNYHSWRYQTKFLFLAGIIIASFLTYLPEFFEAERIQGTLSDNSTVYILVYSDLFYRESYQIGYMMVYKLLLHLAQFFLAIGCTSGLLYYLAKNRVKRKLLLSQTSMSGKKEKEDDMTVTLCAIIGVFVISEIPRIVSVLYKFINHHDNTWLCCCEFWTYWYVTSNVLQLLNSAVNIFIYYPNAASFRISCKQAICKCCYPCRPGNNDAVIEFNNDECKSETYSGTMQNLTCQNRILSFCCKYQCAKKISVDTLHGSPCSSLQGNQNQNSNCSNRVGDESNSTASGFTCFLCCFCCNCTKSKVAPYNIGDNSERISPRMQSRLNASESFSSMAGIPLKAYKQFDYTESHPVSQIESVLMGLRKKSVESYGVVGGSRESMSDVSSTDQLQLEIPVVSQKPFYIL